MEIGRGGYVQIVQFELKFRFFDRRKRDGRLNEVRIECRVYGRSERLFGFFQINGHRYSRHRGEEFNAGQLEHGVTGCLGWWS